MDQNISRDINQGEDIERQKRRQAAIDEVAQAKEKHPKKWWTLMNNMYLWLPGHVYRRMEDPQFNPSQEDPPLREWLEQKGYSTEGHTELRLNQSTKDFTAVIDTIISEENIPLDEVNRLLDAGSVISEQIRQESIKERDGETVTVDFDALIKEGNEYNEKAFELLIPLYVRLCEAGYNRKEIVG